MDIPDIFAFIKSLLDIANNFSEFSQSPGNNEPPPSVDEFINAQRLELLGALVSAQQAREAVAKRESELEEKIMQLEDWFKIEARYKLWEIMPIRFAYRLKLEFVDAGEPFHYICSNCFREKEKSILQKFRQDRKGMGRLHGFVCPKCKQEITGSIGEVNRVFHPTNEETPQPGEC